MRILTLEQRSPDWLAWRNTGLGSSDAAAIVGLSPWASAEKVLKQKVAAFLGQKAESKRDNGAMARGRRLEPIAVAIYEELMGWQIPAVCGTHETHDWLKVSLDGYNAERSLIAEVKAPNKDDHALALAGGVPDKYIPQLLHQYLVSGAKTCHYISFSDYFEKSKRLAVVPFTRDEEMIAALFTAEKTFWDSVVESVSQIERQGRTTTTQRTKKHDATRYKKQ